MLLRLTRVVVSCFPLSAQLNGERLIVSVDKNGNDFNVVAYNPKLAFNRTLAVTNDLVCLTAVHRFCCMQRARRDSLVSIGAVFAQRDFFCDRELFALCAVLAVG